MIQHVHAVNGNTDVYLILADPIEQVVAPKMFNLVFARMGINAVLVPVRVRSSELMPFVQAVLSGSSVRGLWVSIPHKASIFSMTNKHTQLANLAGAVNAVRHIDGGLEGALFDGEGFVRSLNYFKIPYEEKRVLLLGAGGAASAIAVSLAIGTPRPPSEIAIFDVDPSKAVQITRQVGASTKSTMQVQKNNDPHGFDLVINATPLGLLANDPLPCNVSRMGEGTAVVDILMKNQPTPFVRAARQRGLIAQPGFEMLIQQVPMYLDFFGYHEAAEVMSKQPDFLRNFVYPDEMKGEICTQNR